MVTKDAENSTTDDDKRTLDAVLYPHMVEEKLVAEEYDTEANSWRKHVKKRGSTVLDEKQIIGATCQYLVSQATALHEKKFDLIIIDEAAQAAEPDVVMPLTLQSGHVQVIQIGDHKQLPATVKRRP